jgi:hypothetical protein
MKADAPCHFGVLPRPMRSTAGIDYYVEAIDVGSSSSRTPQLEPTVVTEAAGCGGGLPLPPMLSKASVAVNGPAGAPGFPPGFVGGSPVTPLRASERVSPVEKPAVEKTAPQAPPAKPASAPAPPPEPEMISRGGGGFPALLALGSVAVAGGGAAVALSPRKDSSSPTANGGSDRPSNAEILSNPPGTALMGATQVGFEGSASGLGLTYTWAFGDGATATGRVVSHVYASEGTFAVRLTVTNAAGSASASTSIAVRSLSGSWHYSLSSGFQSPVTIVQTGAGFTGTGNGFTLAGSVTDPRVVNFTVQAGSCTETETGSSDSAVDRVNGNVLSCTGENFALVMTRQ